MNLLGVMSILSIYFTYIIISIILTYKSVARVKAFISNNIVFSSEYALYLSKLSENIEFPIKPIKIQKSQKFRTPKILNYSQSNIPLMKYNPIKKMLRNKYNKKDTYEVSNETVISPQILAERLWSLILQFDILVSYFNYFYLYFI